MSTPTLIPATMKAVIVQADKTIAVQDIPVPTIDDDEVLIQTTGKSVTDLSVGDKVAGFVHGGTYKDRGAFAQYVWHSL